MVSRFILSLSTLAFGPPAIAGDISEHFGAASEITPEVSSGPGAHYDRQHWVSSDGCSYSRAQAPGYAPTWHLILNGAHVGLTDAEPHCPVMLTARADRRGQR